jgi:hypothetical protein
VTLPRPLAADGRVDHDPDTNTLIVRPARDAASYAWVLWREGHQAIVNTEEADSFTAWRVGAPDVWADGPGRRQIARGRPGADGTLRFTFAPGDRTYRELASAPDLSATFVVDRATRTIMGVRFRNRSRP